MSQERGDAARGMLSGARQAMSQINIVGNSSMHIEGRAEREQWRHDQVLHLHS